MKNVKFLFVALLLAVGVASCEKDPSVEPVKPTIEFEATEVGIDAYGTANRLLYSIENIAEGAADKLTATYDASWLSVEIGGEVVTLSAERNEAESHRTADVVFSYKGAEDVTVRVIQAGGAEKVVDSVKVEITSVDSTMITFNVTTSRPDITWIPMVTYAEYWTEPINDDEIFLYDLEYFKYLAEINGVKLENFLSEMVGMGTENDIVIDRLNPETEYVIYVYGISTAGERLTDISWAKATTLEAWTGDLTFEFDIKEEEFILEYVITPSHLGVDYYQGIAKESEIEAWKAEIGSDDLAAAIQHGDIECTMQDLMTYGFIDSRGEYFDIFTCYHVYEDGRERVDASTKYILYAAKWDSEANIVGAVSTAEYITPNVNTSDNILDVKIDEITQSSVTVSVKTTNYDPYVVIPVSTSSIEGMSEAEIYAFLLENYNVLVREYTFTGNWSKTFGRMRPGTEYSILTFGHLAGVQTTDMIRIDITTIESGDPKDCTFETLCVPGADNVWVEIIPSDKGHHYFYEIYPEDFTEERAKEFITYVMEHDYEGYIEAFSSWRLIQGDYVTTVEGLLPTTNYKLGIIIMDYDTGEFLSDMYFSEVFTTTEMTYADVSITVNWDKYFDADELCEAGYTQYGDSKGKCIVPVSVDIEGEYSEFYYAFFGNDLTDEAIYADEIFYQDLQSNGLSQPSLILDLPYDKLMTATAVVYDMSYQPGKVFRKAVTFTKDGASPVNDYIAERQMMPLPASLVIAPDATPKPVGVKPERSTDAELYVYGAEAEAAAQSFVEQYRREKAERLIESRRVEVEERRVAR